MSNVDPARLAALRIGFVGAGRLGKALAWSLAQRGLNVIAAASHSRASARALAAPVPGCRAIDPQTLIDACDLVFITTPDAAIEAAVAEGRWHSGAARSTRRWRHAFMRCWTKPAA